MQKHPIPVVRVILEDAEGKILLLKRANSEHGSGRWCLPGGKVDYSQSLEQACISEVKDETNLDISGLEFLRLQENLPVAAGDKHYINFYYSARFSGKLKLNHESSAAEWVPGLEMGSYDIAFGNDEAIKGYFFAKNKRI